MPPKFNIKKNIRDECLRTIAIWILSIAYQQEKVGRKELHQKMYELYHGREGSRIIAYKHEFVKGQGIFKDLWQVDEDLGGAYVLDLKFHRQSKIYVRDSDINTDVLEVKTFNSNELITGRALLDQANSCFCEFKKACAFVKDELTDDGHPKASGDTIEAIVNRLLDFMYSEWKKAQALEKANLPTQGPSKKQKFRRLLNLLRQKMKLRVMATL